MGQTNTSKRSVTASDTKAIRQFLCDHLTIHRRPRATDRKSAEKAITELYRIAEAPEPVILFCKNPSDIGLLSTAIILALRSGRKFRTWKSLADLIKDKQWHAIISDLRKQTTLKKLWSSYQHDSDQTNNRKSPTRTLSLYTNMIFKEDFIAKLRNLTAKHAGTDFSTWTESPLEIDFRTAEVWENIHLNATETLALNDFTFRGGYFNWKPFVLSAFPEFQNESEPFLRQQQTLATWTELDFQWLFLHQALLSHYGRSVYSENSLRLIDALSALESSAYACIFLNGLCIVSDKPTTLRYDDSHRLHDERRPAVAFARGNGLYALQGICVSPLAVTDIQAYGFDAILKENNITTRRLLIERYGRSKFIIDSGAKIIHSDEFGVLYRKEIPHDEALQIVKVINSTPEADGSYAHYFLRVPPFMERAKQAIAWTFGIDEDEYNLTDQS
ncbi:MAG: hypothetical protein C0508_18460 [Cyanobacteria bacterium PR.023]|nr:hypothetical protein [Cyanobacteria bacterium PR.023]